MLTKFDIAFNYLILKDEGSKYSNNPHDSGGPTKWGITKKTYETFFNKKVENSEIEEMPAFVAKQIYTAVYWLPLSCDKISDDAFSCAIYDSGVLYGVGTIGLLTQKALLSCGVAIKLDGKFGDKSASLLNEFLVGSVHDARNLLMGAVHGLLLKHIDEIISKHPEDEEFRNGWTRRADRLFDLLKDGYLNQFKEELFT